jgi:hypothetical protein
MPKYLSEHCLYAPVFQYLSHCPLSHCPIVSLPHYIIVPVSHCPVVSKPHHPTAPLSHCPTISLTKCLTPPMSDCRTISQPHSVPTRSHYPISQCFTVSHSPLSHQSTVPLYTAPLSHCVAVLFLTVITLVSY